MGEALRRSLPEANRNETAALVLLSSAYPMLAGFCVVPSKSSLALNSSIRPLRAASFVRQNIYTCGWLIRQK
jgi:hypothetical protein